MNYRDYKIFVKGGYYHIFNRGVAKMDIFEEKDDFKLFIMRMNENLFPLANPLDGAHQGGVSIVAESHTPYVRKSLPPGLFSLLSYTLMPNHFHFLIRQNMDVPVSKLLLKICSGYSKYFNKKHDRVGSLFQDQFKAVRIQTDEQLLWTSAYIHNNPRTADLVVDLKDYPWGSYLDYIGFRNGTLCDTDFILNMFPNVSAYEKFVDGASDKIKERKDISHLLLD